jgi:hypothetical protein
MSARKRIRLSAPSVLEGVASIVDFGGTIDRHAYHAYKKHTRTIFSNYFSSRRLRETTPFEAVQSDYQSVAKDIAKVSSSMRNSLSK